jgi:hypothetical protein
VNNFFFFYFSFQNAFYKLVMFSRFFKNFKLRSRCNQNDVDVYVKFVIHENDFFFLFVNKKLNLRVLFQTNRMNFDRSYNDALRIN